MKNVSMSVDSEQILTIKVDLKKSYGPSSSGKSVIVASTEGNTAVEDVIVGLNVYKKAA